MGGLVEDFYYGLPEAMLRPPRSRAAEIMAPSRAVDARLAWRGSLRGYTRCEASPGRDGTCACDVREVFVNVSDFKRWPRYRLVELARDRPDLVAAFGAPQPEHT